MTPIWQDETRTAAKELGAEGCAIRAANPVQGLPWGSLPMADSGHSQPCRCGTVAPTVPAARVQIEDRETGMGKMPLPSGASRGVPR